MTAFKLIFPTLRSMTPKMIYHLMEDMAGYVVLQASTALMHSGLCRSLFCRQRVHLGSGLSKSASKCYSTDISDLWCFPFLLSFSRHLPRLQSSRLCSHRWSHLWRSNARCSSRYLPRSNQNPSTNVSRSHLSRGRLHHSVIRHQNMASLPYPRCPGRNGCRIFLRANHSCHLSMV